MKIDDTARVASYSEVAVNLATSAMFGTIGATILKNYSDTYTGIACGCSGLAMSAILMGMAAADGVRISKLFRSKVTK